MKKINWGIIWILSSLIIGGCGASQGEPLDSEIVQESQILSDKDKNTLNKDTLNKDTLNKDSENETVENDKSDITQTAAAGEKIPTIVITQERKEWYSDDEETKLLTVDADRVETAGDGFEALNTALSAQWGGLTGNYDELLQEAKEYYDTIEEKNYFMSFYQSKRVEAYRIDSFVASFCCFYSGYEGGPHDYYAFEGAVFDVKSGKKLQIEDILRDAEGFYDKAVRYIIEELEENYGDELFPEYQDVVETDTFGETSICWYLNNTGIVIEYGLYTVAPYVTGAPSVTLPYDVFDEYLKEEYTSPRSSLIARVMENEDGSRLLGADGKVMLSSAYDEEDGATKVTVVSGDSSETVGAFSQFVMGYVIKRADGRSFLVFYCDYASDDFVTYVYEVTDGKVRECDKLDGASFGGTYIGASGKIYMGTDAVSLFVHLNVFGSYAGNMTYRLTEEGKLIQTEEIFAIDTPYELTVVKDLPVILEGVETTLPAGSVLKITGTDNAGTAYFQLDTQETGIINYVRDEEQWQLLIDGVSENEYFEMLPYVG